MNTNKLSFSLLLFLLVLHSAFSSRLEVEQQPTLIVEEPTNSTIWLPNESYDVQVSVRWLFFTKEATPITKSFMVQLYSGDVFIGALSATSEIITAPAQSFAFRKVISVEAYKNWQDPENARSFRIGIQLADDRSTTFSGWFQIQFPAKKSFEFSVTSFLLYIIGPSIFVLVGCIGAGIMVQRMRRVDESPAAQRPELTPYGVREEGSNDQTQGIELEFDNVQIQEQEQYKAVEDEDSVYYSEERREDDEDDEDDDEEGNEEEGGTKQKVITIEVAQQ